MNHQSLALGLPLYFCAALFYVFYLYRVVRPFWKRFRASTSEHLQWTMLDSIAAVFALALTPLITAWSIGTQFDSGAALITGSLVFVFFVANQAAGILIVLATLRHKTSPEVSAFENAGLVFLGGLGGLTLPISGWFLPYVTTQFPADKP